jgi:hypothetical protein
VLGFTVISSDTIFSVEIQEYESELKRQGSLGSWANTVAFSKMFAYPDHQTDATHPTNNQLISTKSQSCRKGKIIVKGNSIKISQPRLIKVSPYRTPAFTSGAPEFTLFLVWVLTVPAVWKDNAKQFMREAAQQVFCYLSY